jgi:membrane fusion protein (multidrug efflux system)
MPPQTQNQAATNDGNQRQDAKPEEGNDNQSQGETNNESEKKGDQQSDDKGGQNSNGQDKQNDEQEKKPVDPAKKRRGIILGVVIAIVLIAGGVVWYLYSRTYESTDDAQVDGHLNAIASRVNGTVTRVYAENEQPVKAGQVLVELDTKDYEVQAEQARANYEESLAQVAAQNPNVPITRTSNQSSISVDTQEVVNAQATLASAGRDYESNLAKLRQAQVNNRKSQADLARYKQLVDKSEISKSDYDQYLANAGSGDANVDAAQAAADSSAKIVEERRAQLQQQQDRFAQDKANFPRQLAIQGANLGSRKAQADASKAQLDSALLNLSYCHILSPVDGIASERSAEVGGRVSAGQQLIMIVQTESIWVTANFKETQLRKMHVGQTVTLKVDSLGESFSGEVEYMPAATGDKASLFPAENATGNYVKIVQRLPVRIRIDPNQRDFDKLRPGMSVEPKVHLG